MRRSLAILVSIFAVAVGAAITTVSPARAQVGYPPGACTPPVSSQFIGQFVVGQTFSARLTPICVFAAGTAVTLTVNGVNIPGKIAAADGTIGLQVQIVSATQQLVDDPVSVPNVCGNNTAVATGLSTVARGPVTHTATYTVACPVPVAQVASGQLSRTGSDVMKWVGFGAALIVIGAGTVLFVRRRHSATA